MSRRIALILVDLGFLRHVDDTTHRGVAEVADARASGARGLCPCGFESRRPDHLGRESLTKALLACACRTNRPRRGQERAQSGSLWDYAM